MMPHRWDDTRQPTHQERGINRDRSLPGHVRWPGSLTVPVDLPTVRTEPRGWTTLRKLNDLRRDFSSSAAAFDVLSGKGAALARHRLFLVCLTAGLLLRVVT